MWPADISALAVADFASAVQAAASPPSPQIAREAASWLSQLSADARAPQFAIRAWRETRGGDRGADIAVRFFLAGVLVDAVRHKWVSVVLQSKDGEASVAEFADAAREALRECAQSPDMPEHLRNKIVQYAVVLFVELFDDPEHAHLWPDFFDNIRDMAVAGLASLQRGGSRSELDVFLRVMQTLDDELLNRDALRNTLDVSRSNEIKELLKADSTHYIADFVEVWLQLMILGAADFLSDEIVAAESVDEGELDLVARALQDLELCVAWLPIHLVVNDRVLPVLVQFMSVGSDPSLGVSFAVSQARMTLRDRACDVVLAVLLKGISDPAEKLSLLDALGPVTALIRQALQANDVRQNGELVLNSFARVSQNPQAVLPSPSFVDALFDENQEFLERMGRIVDVTGVSLLAVISTVLESPEADGSLIFRALSYLADLLPLALDVLCCDDDDVSQRVIPFLLALISSMRKGQVSTAQLGEFSGDAANSNRAASAPLTCILVALAHKLKLNPSFSFDASDEDDRESFEKYRNMLSNVFRQICILDVQICCSFVEQTFQEVMAFADESASRGSTDAFPNIEVAFHLVDTLSEVPVVILKVFEFPENEQKAAAVELFLHGLLHLMATSSLSQYPHFIVTERFFEVAVKVFNVLKDGSAHELLKAGDSEAKTQEIVRNMLMAFLDGRGVRHPLARTQSRATYLLVRFLRVNLDAALPFLESILEALADLLPVEQQLVQFDDQCNIFDAIGLLVAQTASDKAPIYVEQVLSPVLSGISDILGQQLWIQDTQDAPVFATHLSKSLALLSFFSREFKNIASDDHAMEGVVSWFEESVRAGAVVVSVLPQNDYIRKQGLFLCHRMVETLGPHLFRIRQRGAGDSEDAPSCLQSILDQLVANSTAKDFNDVVRLVNQISRNCNINGSLDNDGFALIDSLIIPLSTKFSALWSDESICDPPPLPSTLAALRDATRDAQAQQLDALSAAGRTSSAGVLAVAQLAGQQTGTTLSEPQRCYLELQKGFVGFVQALCNHCDLLFVSPRNAAFLPSLLQSLLDIVSGTAAMHDTSIQRSVFMIFRVLIEKSGWITRHQEQNPEFAAFQAGFDAFVQFVHQELCVTLIRHPLSPEFDESRDAIAANVLQDIVHLHRDLMAAFGQVYVSRISCLLADEIGLDQNGIDTFLQNLQTMGVRPFRNWLSNALIQPVRAQMLGLLNADAPPR